MNTYTFDEFTRPEAAYHIILDTPGELPEMLVTLQVVKAVEDEMRTLKYYFKSTRRDEAPRR